jgi:hypothetical protein
MEELVESDVALVEQEPTHERDSRSIAECARFEKAGEPSKRVVVGAVFDAFAAPLRAGAESEERKSRSLGAEAGDARSDGGPSAAAARATDVSAVGVDSAVAATAEELSDAEDDASDENDESKWGPKGRWPEAARLRMHFLLLKDLECLRYDKTPLGKVIELAAWLASDDETQQLPFSFARCVQVAQLYPGLYPTDEFEGLQGIDLDAATQMIRNALRPRIQRRLSELPEALRQRVVYQTGEVLARLATNPQWLNEKKREMTAWAAADPNGRLVA